jgi:hypothetical protein
VGAVVGSDVERYVRMLAMSGVVRPLPWANRGFLSQDLADLLRGKGESRDPWGAEIRRALQPRAAVGLAGTISGNSGFAWGSNDGAMWQGRGANASVGASASFRWGPLTAVAAPVAFWSQNAPFALDTVPNLSATAYADALYSNVVDLPQRMGPSGFSRVDPGESTIRLSVGSIALGVSTASQGWGLGSAFPAILGPNAGGFPHAFVGTRSTGLAVPWLGVISSRYILGVLDQSPWSTVQGSETYVNTAESGTRRVGTGVVVSWMPAMLPQLEIGASRFFHSPFREGTDKWRAWSKPFEGVFKARLRGTPGAGDPTGDADNQLASFFARFVSPRRGVEASFELLREDHNWDARDLAQEAENNSAVFASVRAIVSRRPTGWTVVSLEYFDGDVRPTAQARAQQAIYVHTGMRQGHTLRGQQLGAAVGVGAIAAQSLTIERFASSGARRLRLQRARSRSYQYSDFEGLYRRVSTTVPVSHDWVLDGSVGWSSIAPRRTFSADAGMVYSSPTRFQNQRTNLYLRAAWSIF